MWEGRGECTRPNLSFKFLLEIFRLKMENHMVVKAITKLWKFARAITRQYEWLCAVRVIYEIVLGIQCPLNEGRTWQAVQYFVSCNNLVVQSRVTVRSMSEYKIVLGIRCPLKEGPIWQAVQYFVSCNNLIVQSWVTVRSMSEYEIVLGIRCPLKVGPIWQAVQYFVSCNNLIVQAWVY